ncbi:DUF4190 domain-containing protein [Halalkalibacter flavus]|uniref:DUF4190 domain-containing protein n=1 Tax=Halalkalibacter flavus TaxID=3090668 RepID=UPI002FC69AEA
MGNGKAITSFVFGILSILAIIIMFLGIVVGMVGLIFGIIALKEMERFEKGEKKLAIIGIVCSSIGIFLPILFSIIAITAFMNPSP